MHQMNSKVRPLLDLVDKLRAVGIEKDLPIPQIAVMGDQSSGKSSVLEALSGVQFPRGTGLVTKCATELRMKNQAGAAWDAKISLNWPYPQPDEAGSVSSPEELGDKIEALTQRMLETRGKKATFESEHSILIELVSSEVPDLTIIDLPGIVRTTLEGQSKTVIAEVDSLLQRFLEQKRTIILAVIPSNVDIATVDIIERATIADPLGDRTVGVLTKPDMIGEGCEQEKVDTLLNLTKPLKLGYIMVKNRSQKQIDDGMDLAEAKDAERVFFNGNQHFRSLDRSLFGIDNLSSKLTYILVDRIKESIPYLRKEIKDQQEKTAQELESLGIAPPSCASESRELLANFLRAVMGDVDSAIDGNYESKVLKEEPLMRIRAKFRELSSAFNQRIIGDQPRWTVSQIKQAIKETRGRELAGFPNFSVFEHLVRQFVLRWEVQADKMLVDTKKVAIEACDLIIERHVLQSPLFRRIGGVLQAHLQDAFSERVDKAKANTLRELIDNELAPMTENHYFMELYNKSRMAAFEKVVDGCFTDYKRHNTLSGATLDDMRTELLDKYAEINTIGTEANETQEAEDFHAMLHAYWKTSSKRFIDNAIQMVTSTALRRNMSTETISAFNKFSEDQIHGYFAGEVKVEEKRVRMKAKLERLQAAYKLVTEMGV